MRREIQFGGWSYVSFMILDLICLLLANVLSYRIYIQRRASDYSFEKHFTVIVIMVLVDVLVTLVFETLHLVLRRKKMEVFESVKHVLFSFIGLAVILFTIRRGAAYSRIVIFTAYTIDFVLITGTHVVWKKILKRLIKKSSNRTAILMTTDRFVNEGLEELRKLNIEVRNIYLLKNINRNEINGIPVVKTAEDVASVICWKMLDKV